LLTDMRDRRQHMALLVDEHGTAVGVITMEDILEQIVGDIWDEYDDASQPTVERCLDGHGRHGRNPESDAVRR
jgi:magnesium and cobalt transporter